MGYATLWAIGFMGYVVLWSLLLCGLCGLWSLLLCGLCGFVVSEAWWAMRAMISDIDMIVK
jgi:hypothetical protein